MKKNILTALTLIALIATTPSCSREESNLFDYSAAQRMENMIENTRTILLSAKNGWEMQYFTSSSSAGYSMLVKFDKNSGVMVAAKNALTTSNKYKSAESLWDVIGDNGPVITFNTYNDVLHAFSDPQSDGIGNGGDYEFIVLSATENEIKLKGKKESAYILMKRLADDQSWTEYFNKLDAINSTIFEGAPNTMNLVVGADTLIASDGITHIFSIYPKDGDPLTDAVSSPFIITPTGIRMYSSYAFNNKTVQNFNLNADKSELVSIESPDVKLIGPQNLGNFLSVNINTWLLEPTLLSPKLQTTYDLVLQACKTKYKAVSINLYLKYYSKNDMKLILTLTTAKSKIDGYVFMNIPSYQKDAITLLYNGSNDNNGKSFYTNLASFKELTQTLSSSFTISTESSINPKSIKFTNKNDTDSWFTALRQ